jgi:hypothetical protein
MKHLLRALLLAAPIALTACPPPEHDLALLRRALFPSWPDGDPKALIGGFRVGTSWKRVRAARDDALRLREEERDGREIRAIYLHVGGSSSNRMTLDYELRDGDVVGVTATITGEGDTNRAALHDLATEAFAWLDAQLGAELSSCASAPGSCPIDAEFERKLDKPSTCWWRRDGTTIARLERRHYKGATPNRTFIELEIAMRLEGLPEAPTAQAP